MVRPGLTSLAVPVGSSGNRTTEWTPGMFRIASKLKLLTSPPQTGHALTAAYNMSGSRTSMAYFACPVTFSGTSRFFCSVPISVHWSGGFILTRDGSTSIRAARSAIAPYVVRRPVAA